MALTTQDQMLFVIRKLIRSTPLDSILLDFAAKYKQCPIDEADVLACTRERLSADWVRIYDQEHAAFLAAPLRNKETRLALLSEAALDAKARNAIADFFKFAEQIAKDEGGFFEGKPAKGDAPGTPGNPNTGPIQAIEIIVVDPKPLPPEQLP